MRTFKNWGVHTERGGERADPQTSFAVVRDFKICIHQSQLCFLYDERNLSFAIKDMCGFSLIRRRQIEMVSRWFA